MGCGATTAHSYCGVHNGAPIVWKDGAADHQYMCERPEGQRKAPVGNALSWIRWRRGSVKGKTPSSGRGDSFSIIPSADKVWPGDVEQDPRGKKMKKKKSDDSASKKKVLSITEDAKDEQQDDEFLEEMTTRSGSGTSSRHSISPVQSRAERLQGMDLEESPQSDPPSVSSIPDTAQKCGAYDEGGTISKLNDSAEDAEAHPRENPLESQRSIISVVEDETLPQPSNVVDTEECSSVTSMSCKSGSPLPQPDESKLDGISPLDCATAPETSASTGESIRHVEMPCNTSIVVEDSSRIVAVPQPIEASSPASVHAAEMPPLSDSSQSMLSMSVEECPSPNGHKDDDEKSMSVEEPETPESNKSHTEAACLAKENGVANEPVQSLPESCEVVAEQEDLHRAPEANIFPITELSNLNFCRAEASESAECVVNQASKASTTEADEVPPNSESAESAADPSMTENAPTTEAYNLASQKATKAANVIDDADDDGDAPQSDLVAAVLAIPKNRPLVGLAGIICNEGNASGAQQIETDGEANEDDAHFKNLCSKVAEIDIHDDDDLMFSGPGYADSGNWTFLDESNDWDDSEGLELPGLRLTRQALEQRLEVARSQSRLGQAETGSPCDSPSDSASSSPQSSPDGSGPPLTPGSEIDWSMLYNLATEDDDEAEMQMLGYMLPKPFLGLETICEESNSDCEEEANDAVEQDMLEEQVQDEEEEVPMKLPERPNDEEKGEAIEEQLCQAETEVYEKEIDMNHSDPEDEDIEEDKLDTEDEDDSEEESEKRHYMRDSLKMVDLSQLANPLPMGRGTPSVFERYSLSSLHEDMKQVDLVGESSNNDVSESESESESEQQ